MTHVRQLFLLHRLGKVIRCGNQLCDCSRVSFQNIGVIGVGGVGGFFGGKLCAASSAKRRIHFVARGDHLRAIQRQGGLLLSSEDAGGRDLLCKPFLATDEVEKLPALDLCLLCVKAFDLAGVLLRLKPIIKEHTVVLPLLNGVDVSARIRAVIEEGIVLPACVYLGTHIERPGKVRQKGGACKILFGPDPRHPEFDCSNVLSLFAEAGIKAESLAAGEIRSEIWKKFIFIAAYGLVSAAFDKTLGEICQDEVLANEVRAIISEATAVALASGVSLPQDIVEISLAKADAFPPQAKTSFQRDFERNDKSDERDLFAGALIRTAEQLKIDVPQTRALAKMLESRKPLGQ